MTRRMMLLRIHILIFFWCCHHHDALVFRPHPPSSRHAALRMVEVSEYDVVEYAVDEDKLGLGVVLADGSVQPLCGVDPDQTEFVWDMERSAVEASRVRRIVENAWPTSRQLDGGMGPANPHGDICEDLYIVNPEDLSEEIVLVVKTDREWW